MGSLKLSAERSLGPCEVRPPLPKMGYELEALALTALSPGCLLSLYTHFSLILVL